MEEAATPSSLIPFEARLVGWLSVGFVLDVAQLGRFDAPELDALLVAAVIEANVNRLNRDPELQAAHARLDSAPPDDLRRPVSINALAASLRLPFETVRRHVNKLIRQGFLASAPGGVIVPTSVLVSPQFVAAAIARYERVLQFHAELAAAGVADPITLALPPVGHPQAPVRAVGRILSDYFFRTMDALLRQLPDPLTGLLLLDIIRANTEQVAPAQAAAGLRLGWLGEAERVSVRVAQLSRRLAIPYETTRRHVGWLVERGFCRRVGAGVQVEAAFRESSTLLSVTTANLANVRRMYRQIAGLSVGQDQVQDRGQTGEAAGF